MNAFHVRPQWHRKLNTIVTALVFIIVGISVLGKNLGWVDNSVFNIIISWQTLLMVIAVVQFIKRNFLGGFILLAVGIYFLIPSSYGIGEFWPILLIIIGLGILFKLLRKPGYQHHGVQHIESRGQGDAVTDNGFVDSSVTFGGTKHIVLDPVFRGANLSCTFGAIELDLRRTVLENEQTFIDVRCTFGGIELCVPPHWNVLIEADCTMGGIEDKRSIAGEIDYSHKLIIRGDVHFSGIDIKN